MNKNSITDYWGCIVFRLLGPVFRIFPVALSLFFGEKLGELFYYFDLKHRALVYANLKTAFGKDFLPAELSRIVKRFYRHFGQNLIEIFLIPKVNQDYIKKYIAIDGKEYIDEAFKKGKGVILVGVHAGSWELSNIISANLGFSFSLLARDQRHPRLDVLLNSYRMQKGCRVLQRQNQTRQLVEAIKKNEAIGMTADQGGKNGIQVNFFGKEASLPSGAIRMALKYGSAILPAIYVRTGGAHIKLIIAPPLPIKETGDHDKDIRENLQELIHVFEKHIKEYPHEYLWSYKVWKYGRQKNILILSDRITGHLRQAQAVANIAGNYLKSKKINVNIVTIDVEFKNRFAGKLLAVSSCLFGKYRCQGCLWCLKKALKDSTYSKLISIKPDLIISCGSSVAALNYILSRENLSSSVAVMRPSILSLTRFNLVIMPRHDCPPKRKNVVISEGALNLINDDYLENQAQELRGEVRIDKALIFGLLIGGDTKNFRLDLNLMEEIVRQIKVAAEELDAEILITTSRRTPKAIEELIKGEFRNYPRCKLVVVANEKNFSSAVGGILALAQVIITSPESISMISEAANSKKYVLVFDAPGIRRRHREFLNLFARNKYIYMTQGRDLAKTIIDTWMNKPPISALKDALTVKEAIANIL